MDSSPRVLVTGGAGYIGSHVVRELLAQGFEVAILDNLSAGHESFVPADVVFARLDLADVDALDGFFALESFDAVIHLAGCALVEESVRHPEKYVQNNIVNGANLLNAMKRHHVENIVFSSSCATYGIPSTTTIREDTPQNPVNPYGFTKLVFERMLEYYDHAYGLRFVALRYFNAAGAMPDVSIGEWHEPESHVIPLMFDRLGKGTFQVFGTDYPTPDGSCIRDYVHVCDLATAHVKAVHHLLQGKQSEKINLGTGQGTSVLQLIDVVEKISGNKLLQQIGPRREGDPPYLVADACKARLVLDWQPKYDIRDIVVHAWTWHQKLMTIKKSGLNPAHTM